MAMNNIGEPDSNSLSLTQFNSASLIKTFPTEILIEVFIRVPTSYGQDHQRAPWILGVICREWRNIALSHSQLWSNITLSTITLNGVADPESMLVVWLQRSGSRLLDIGYNLRETRPSNPGSLFALLIPHSRRWRSLWFDVSSSQLVPALKSLKGRLPSLRALHIYQIVRLASGAFGAFSDAPNLATVTLRLFHAGTIATPNLPWERLTNLKLNSVVLLNDIHNLRLPSLTNLSLFQTGGPESTIATVTRFLRRSPCSLQYLGLLRFTATSASEMVDLYRCIPHLVNFEIDLGFKAMLEMVLLPLLVAHDQCWLPELQYLLIRTVAKGKRQANMESMLAEVVESRSGEMAMGDMPTVAGLKMFSYCGDISVAGSRRLNGLMQSREDLVVSLNPKGALFPTWH